MGLEAGSATGQLELDISTWKQGFVDAANAAKKAGDGIDEGMASAQKTIAALESDLLLGAKSVEVFGQSEELLKTRQNQLKTSIVSLLKDGIEPNSAAVKELKEQYDSTSEELKQYEDDTDSLTDKLGSLIATAGSMATVKAGVSAIMGSMNDWAEAELATDRLRKALEFKGVENSFDVFIELGSRLQTLTGVSNNTIEQIAATSIAQGKSVQQTYDLVNAAASYASVTGKDINSVYEQLNKTYAGTAGELGETIPELRNMTSEQLANGDAVKYVIEQYGGFIGQVGSTKVALDVMNQTVGDASETFGSAMTPIVLVATNAITGLASVVANAGTVMKTIMAVGATVVMTAFTGLTIRTGILAAAKWGLFGAQMAVNAATAVGNPLLWAGIAAAVGLVAATGAIIAAKVKEAKAIKTSTDALDTHKFAITSAMDALNLYTGAVDQYSDAQLKAAQSDLQSALALSKDMVERVAITQKLKEVTEELAERRKGADDASSAKEYADAMSIVKDTINDNVSAEDKLYEKLNQLDSFRGETNKEELQRLYAMSIVRTEIHDLELEQIEKEDEEKKTKAEEEKQRQEDAAKLYETNMQAVYGFLDERVRKEAELKSKIEELSAFQTSSESDELLRLSALQNAQKELNELHKGTEVVSFWETAGKALDAYADKMNSVTLSAVTLAQKLGESASYVFQQIQTITTQYYATESSKLAAAYAEDKKALEDQLKSGLITQEQYDKRLALLDEANNRKKNDLAKKQFEDEKKFKTAEVWINAASAVSGWWTAAAQLGPIAGPIFATGMTLATGAMAAYQTSLIAEEEYVPSYADGGTHSGGLARINEEGAEIVDLPDGTTIVPRDLSEKIAEGNYTPRNETNIYLSFDGARIDETVDLEKLAEEVSEMIAEKVAK